MKRNENSVTGWSGKCRCTIVTVVVCGKNGVSCTLIALTVIYVHNVENFSKQFAEDFRTDNDRSNRIKQLLDKLGR